MATSRTEALGDRLAALWDRAQMAPVLAYEKRAGNADAAVGITPEILNDKFEPEPPRDFGHPYHVVAVVDVEGRLYAGLVVDPDHVIDPNDSRRSIPVTDVPPAERGSQRFVPVFSNRLNDSPTVSVLTPNGQLVTVPRLDEEEVEQNKAIRLTRLISLKGLENFEERALRALQRQQAAFQVFEQRAQDAVPLPGLGEPAERGRLFVEGVTFDGRYVIGLPANERPDYQTGLPTYEYLDDVSLNNAGGAAFKGGLQAVRVPGRGGARWEYIAAGRRVTYPVDTNLRFLRSHALNDAAKEISAAMKARVKEMGDTLESSPNPMDDAQIGVMSEQGIRDFEAMLDHYARTGEALTPGALKSRAIAEAEQSKPHRVRNALSVVIPFLRPRATQVTAPPPPPQQQPAPVPQPPAPAPAPTPRPVTPAQQQQQQQGAPTQEIPAVTPAPEPQTTADDTPGSPRLSGSMRLTPLGSGSDLSAAVDEVQTIVGRHFAPKFISDNYPDVAGDMTMRALLLVSSNDIANLDPPALRRVELAFHDLKKIASRAPQPDGSVSVRPHELRRLAQAREAVQGELTTEGLQIFAGSPGSLGARLTEAIEHHLESQNRNAGPDIGGASI